MSQKLTVRDVCQTYGLSERTVRRYLAEGLLTATKVGPRLIRLDAEQVEQALTGSPPHSLRHNTTHEGPAQHAGFFHDQIKEERTCATKDRESRPRHRTGTLDNTHPQSTISKACVDVVQRRNGASVVTRGDTTHPNPRIRASRRTRLQRNTF